MKKFLKTTLAGVALLGCATGLVGCGSNNDTADASIAPEKAYETVYGAMGTNFSGIARGFGETTESTGTKNKLTIDLNILNQSTSFLSNQTDETNMSLQAILQTCWGNKNQLSFALGLKKDNEFDELINAYISDPEINPLTDLQEIESEEDFNSAVLVYKLKSAVVTPTSINDFTRVSDTETYEEGTTYYAVTSAKLTAYLSSNLYKLASFELVSDKPDGWEDGAYIGYYYVDGDLEEGEDYRTKIKEFVGGENPTWEANKYYKVSDGGSSLNGVPEMLYNGKTAITTDLVELMGSLSEYLPSTTTLDEVDPEASEDPSSDDSQLSALMPIISSVINGEMEYEDFNTYVKLLTNNQVSISGRLENGNTVLSISFTSDYEGDTEAITIELIAYADGAFGISYHEVYSCSYEGTKQYESVTSISCKMTLTSDFDDTLVPDLSSEDKKEAYTEVSLEDIITGLIGGGSGEEHPDIEITE